MIATDRHASKLAAADPQAHPEFSAGAGRLASVFLTWNDSRRSISLADLLGIPRVMIVPHRAGVVRHIGGTLLTALFLARHRPRVIWFQYSIALGAVLGLYAALARRGEVRLVTDIHTKALRRQGPVGVRWLVRLAKRWSLKRCWAAVLTNPQNAGYTKQVLEARSVILPDPLPRPVLGVETGPEPTVDVVFICSYAEDEPMQMMYDAIRQLGPGVRVAITGNDRALEPEVREQLSSVAHLTGFLPEEAYWRLLRATRSCVVLSTEEACVPCGAYEAIALGKRPIVADDPEVRRVFEEAAIYTPLQASAIREVICRQLESEPSEQDSDESLAQSYLQRWERTWFSARHVLAQGRALPEGLTPLPPRAAEIAG